jgi:hypothetical protein
LCYQLLPALLLQDFTTFLPTFPKFSGICQPRRLLKKCPISEKVAKTVGEPKKAKISTSKGIWKDKNQTTFKPKASLRYLPLFTISQWFLSLEGSISLVKKYLIWPRGSGNTCWLQSGGCFLVYGIITQGTLTEGKGSVQLTSLLKQLVCKKVKNTFSIKSSCSKPFSTKRSNVQSFPFH